MLAVEMLQKIMANQPDAFSRTAAALWARVGRETGLADLEWARGLGLYDAPQLLFDGLTQSGALNSGVVEPIGLHRFLGQILNESQSDLSMPAGDIVWTLPSPHPASALRGRSLMSACLKMINRAKSKLVITSPYIESRGVGRVQEALLNALDRGVEIILLGGNLVDIASIESRAIEGLRQAATGRAGALKIYSAVTNNNSVKQFHPLLHAKLVISDQVSALISSANLTLYGLTSNFEVGALVQGSNVSDLAEVVAGLLASTLVTHIATV